MPQEPKKRHSRQRQGKRRAHIELKNPAFSKCPNCQKPTAPHTVCKYCGFYKGQQFKKIKSKAAVRKVEK